MTYPYYVRLDEAECVCLLSEEQCISVVSIQDFRAITVTTTEMRMRRIREEGVEIKQEEFKAFYQQAITDIDEQTPCSDLKLSDPLPAIPY
jgi:hypothetical protein